MWPWARRPVWAGVTCLKSKDHVIPKGACGFETKWEQRGLKNDHFPWPHSPNSWPWWKKKITKNRGVDVKSQKNKKQDFCFCRIPLPSTDSKSRRRPWTSVFLELRVAGGFCLPWWRCHLVRPTSYTAENIWATWPNTPYRVIIWVFSRNRSLVQEQHLCKYKPGTNLSFSFKDFEKSVYQVQSETHLLSSFK